MSSLTPVGLLRGPGLQQFNSYWRLVGRPWSISSTPSALPQFDAVDSEQDPVTINYILDQPDTALKCHHFNLTETKCDQKPD